MTTESPAGEATTAAQPTRPAAPRRPPVLDGLEVIEQLQQTEAKVTYRARRTPGGSYALTVLTGPAELSELNRRAGLLTGLHHPWLPRVHEVGRLPQLSEGSEGELYLVTDLVPGRPLADQIAGNPLSGWPAVTLALDLARPLAAMHRLGLVHGDVNPQNVTVLDDGSARLRDVGLLAPGPGVLGYAAPEQSGALARPVDSRSDLYSLGVTLFEALTGSLPFVATDAAELLRLHADATAPDPRSRGADISSTLAAILTTLLAPDPDRRYQSGEALASDLQRLLEDPAARFEPDPGRTVAGSATGGPQLVGRDRELGLLTDLWDQVRQGEGQGCALRGAAGSGTSRLAAEVLQIARRTGAPVLTIPCALDSAVPLAPLRQAFDDLLAEAEALPEAKRTDLHDRIRAAAGSAAPVLAGLSPALAALLGVERLPDGDRHDQFAAAVARFIADLARRSGGLMLISQDAELVDAAMLRVMSHLATELGDVPLLSIGTVRQDRHLLPPDHLLLPAVYSAIDLDLTVEPLAPPAVAVLIAEQLPGLDPSSPLAETVIARGHGNPYVVLELIRAVVDAGLLRPHWGGWRLDEAGLDRLELTEDPLDLARARIARLEPAGRRLFVAAAVIGPRFRPDVLAQVAGMSLEVVQAALAEAAGHQLLELAGGGDYRFGQDRLREAVLHDVEPEERAALHRRIAEVLDNPAGSAGSAGSAGLDTSDELVYTIAQHHVLGAPARHPDRAFELCRIAGRLALAADAPGASTIFLDHAVSLRPDDPTVRETLGTALFRDARYEPARAQLEQALAGTAEPLDRARILATLTDLHRATWNTPAAVGTMEQGLAELGARHRPAGLIRAVATVSIGLVAWLITASGWGFGTARGRRRERQHRLAALHLAGCYLGTINVRRREILAHRMRAALAAARLGAGREFTLSCAGVGLTAAALGRPGIARRCLARADAAAAGLGDPQVSAQVAWYAGAADYTSRTDNGERWIRALVDHGDWLDARQYGDTVATVCWEAAVQGRRAEVQKWYAKGRRRAGFGGPDQVTSLLPVNAVRLATAGETEAAGAELERARAVLENYGALYAGRLAQINLVLAEMYALLEREEYGDELEVTAARFFGFGLSPAETSRPHRAFLMLHARARLAQYRATPSAEIYLLLARRAVRSLKKVADTPLLRAAHQQCRAELQLLEGRPERALRLLAELQPLREDAPLFTFEVNRTRARALLAADYQVEAGRQIRSLLILAEEHDWPARLRSLEAEFGVRPVGSRSAAEQAERAGRAIRRRRDLAEKLRPPFIPEQRGAPGQENLD